MIGTVHSTAQRHGRGALAVIQGDRLVLVVSGELHGSKAAREFMADLMDSSPTGPS